MQKSRQALQDRLQSNQRYNGRDIIKNMLLFGSITICKHGALLNNNIDFGNLCIWVHIGVCTCVYVCVCPFESGFLIICLLVQKKKTTTVYMRQ